MARLKARRSRYRFTHRLAGTAPAAILVVLLLVTIGGTTYLASRVLTFVNHVTAGGVSIASLTQAAGITEPPLGSIAYRLKHKAPVPINILVLGYGGQENDAPYLTDSIMAVRLDPGTGRIAMISIPRDLYVSIPAWPAASGITDHEKVNAAFEYGTDESQADALGSHLMSEAGYDPIEMARFFEKLSQGGSRGPQFLSDHPNPGNCPPASIAGVIRPSVGRLSTRGDRRG